MVNTEFKFQAKTPNSSKVHIHKESKNNFKFNLTLKVKVKVTSFQTHLRHFKIQFKLEGKIQHDSNFRC